MSFGQGINVFSGRQRTAGWSWPRSSTWLGLTCGCSLLGYICLFLLLHLNSLGWAPGQILEPFTVYWELFYRVVFDQERVLASRRSAAAALHPALMIGAIGVIATGYITMMGTLRALPEARRPQLRGLIGLALLFSVPLMLLPNLLSGDIYSYISFGRIATLHAGNPFVDPPGSFRHDMYLQWVNWSAVPSVYGPTWIYLSILITVLVESVHSSVLAYVLAYKLLAMLLHLLSGVLIWSILWHWKPEQRSWGTALYLLNPLALIEFVGNGHNDALMIALILLGILLHLRGQWLWTVVAFTLAVLTKWIALPLLPLYGLLLLARSGQWRRRLQYAAGCLGMFAGLTVALYLPYWQGPVTLKVLLDAPPQKRLINSLGDMVVRETQYGMYLLGYWPHPALRDFSPLIMRLDQPRDAAQDEGQAWRRTQRTRLLRYNQIQAAQQLAAQGHERALAAVTRFTGLTLLLGACIVGAFVTRNLRMMLLAGAWILFVYTTIAAVWVWPWYATWFVALAAVLDWRVTGRTAIMLSLLMLLLYPLFPPLPEPTLIERYRALIVFGPPLAYAGWHFFRVARSFHRREWSFDDLAG